MSYWLPSTEHDIESAIENGTLTESQHLDVKLTYPPQDPNSNRAMAQDLAAFAIDGGAILVGVRQDGSSLVLEPQPLDEIEALAERASQVSRDRPSPPILVPTRVIPSEREPGMAYLLMEIPPSPTAPHSVDGTYWARGERANRRLTDDREVDRLIRARMNVENLASEILDAERPGPLEQPGAALYVVAEPVQAHDDESLLRLSPTNRRHPWTGVDGAVFEIAKQTDGLPLRLEGETGRHPGYRDRFDGSDGLSNSPDIQRRARGRAVVASGSARARTELEVHEHGRIILVRERIAQTRQLRSSFTSDDDVELKVLDDEGIVVSTWRAIVAAREVGRRIGYRGVWSFAIEVRDIEKTIASSQNRGIDDRLDLGSRSLYDQYSYHRSTTASMIELEHSPMQVLYRLTGRLVRGLNVEEHYFRWIDGWPADAAINEVDPSGVA